MPFLPQREDVPPETFSFYEVHTLDFDEMCGHQHVRKDGPDGAIACAETLLKKYRRRKPWPGVAIWRIGGLRDRVFEPRRRTGRKRAVSRKRWPRATTLRAKR